MDHAIHHATEPSQEYDLDLNITAGTWPDGLHGHAFIIGPSQPALAGWVFTGTGIVTRVDLAPNAEGHPHWRSKFVVTPDIQIIKGLASNLDPETFGAVSRMTARSRSMALVFRYVNIVGAYCAREALQLSAANVAAPKVTIVEPCAAGTGLTP